MTTQTHNPTTVETEGIRLRLKQLSKQTLEGFVRASEQSVARGTALEKDYETFIVCQSELARRVHHA